MLAPILYVSHTDCVYLVPWPASFMNLRLWPPTLSLRKLTKVNALKPPNFKTAQVRIRSHHFTDSSGTDRRVERQSSLMIRYSSVSVSGLYHCSLRMGARQTIGYAKKNRPMLLLLCCSRNQRGVSMSRFEKLSHVIWHCQYHIVWLPKYRYRVLRGSLGKFIHFKILFESEKAGCIFCSVYMQKLTSKCFLSFLNVVGKMLPNSFLISDENLIF